MQENYHLNKHSIRLEVNNQSWEDIDHVLPQIPQGVYTFEPSGDELSYYRRLLYCLNSQQQSERAFKLAAYILAINTNNYYALMLRSECFKKVLGKCADKQEYTNLLVQELNFTSCLLNRNPKEYQIWNYKKDLISCHSSKKHGVDFEILLKMEEEFIFYLMTSDDQKNYHAWDYKTWLSRQSQDLETRIKQTEAMLFIGATSQEFECRTLWENCYSCWSYRFNLIKDLPEQKRIQYFHKQAYKIQEYIRKNPSNECAWNYLQGIIESSDLPTSDRASIVKNVHELGTSSEKENKFLWSFLLQVADKQISTEALNKLKSIDSIRKLYYSYLQQLA